MLHGLYMKRMVMTPLCMRIKKAGFDVHNYEYKSLKVDVKKIAIDLAKVSSNYESVILVGHSLGGIVSKEVFGTGVMNNIRSIITIGTPHKGSEVARVVDRVGMSMILGKAASVGLVRNATVAWEGDVSIHCIAGYKDIGVVRLIPRVFRSSSLMFSDGTVSVDEAIIANATSKKIFNHSHTSLIYSKKVSDYIITVINDVLKES